MTQPFVYGFQILADVGVKKLFHSYFVSGWEVVRNSRLKCKMKGK